MRLMVANLPRLLRTSITSRGLKARRPALFDDHRETRVAAQLELLEILLATLGETPGRLRALLAGVDPALLTRPAVDGGWSVAQNIAHMCAVESPYHARLVRLALEDNPRMAAIGSTTGEYDPETPASILADTFADLRARTVAFLQTLSPLAYSRPGVHAELGPGTLRSQVEALLRHDENHLAYLAGAMGREGK